MTVSARIEKESYSISTLQHGHERGHEREGLIEPKEKGRKGRGGGGLDYRHITGLASLHQYLQSDATAACWVNPSRHK